MSEDFRPPGDTHGRGESPAGVPPPGGRVSVEQGSESLQFGSCIGLPRGFRFLGGDGHGRGCGMRNCQFAYCRDVLGGGLTWVWGTPLCGSQEALQHCSQENLQQVLVYK